MIIRSMEEIKQKIKTGFENDVFNFGIYDLMDALPFEEAKPHLSKEFLKDPKAEEKFNKERLVSKVDVLKKMEDYLPFAFKKAENQRGLSADRSVRHFAAWAWLIDDDFYQEIEKMYDENYYPYGLPILKRVEEWIKQQKASLQEGVR